MERRAFDSPMDFEYEDRKAQIPADSPWLSGTKTLFQRNTFRNPANVNMPQQPSRTSKPLPQTPIKNHVTMFRDNPALDFSSGGENASSPEADNEDTPDMKQPAGLNENITVFRGNHVSPSKAAGRPASPIKSSTRASISNWVSKFSPSHKSLIRKDQTRHAGAVKRPPKRKRRELEQDVTQDSGSEHDSDGNGLAAIQRPHSSSPRKTSGTAIGPPPAELGTIPAILKFINDHPSLPHILSWWAQMLVSSFVMVGVIYILYSFWSAIQRDVDLKAEELSSDLLREIGLCSENFLQHDCLRREHLGSKFKTLCDDWEACMKQDHRAVGRAKISVSTWAEIINGFVEPLSGKIIFLGVALFTISIAVPHVLFGLIRQKSENAYPANIGRTASGGNFNDNPFAGGQEQYFTPMHNRNYDAFAAQGLASGRQSPSKASRIVGDESPIRRIQYR